MSAPVDSHATQDIADQSFSPSICIGMLKTENWKPATKINSGTFHTVSQSRETFLANDALVTCLTVIRALYDLLQTPNPDDPLVTSIVSYLSSVLPRAVLMHIELPGRAVSKR